MNSSRRIEELIDLAQKMDDDAWNELCSTMEPKLRSYLQGLLAIPKLKRRIDVEDVLQNVHLAVLRGVSDLRDGTESGFWHWVYAICRYQASKALDHHMAERRNVHREQYDHDEEKQHALLEHAAAILSTPSQKAALNEQDQKFQRTLEQLDDKAKEVIRLRYFEKLSRKETAAAMGCSVFTVDRLLSQALAAFARLWND